VQIGCERAQRVVDRPDDRRRTADRTALADPFTPNSVCGEGVCMCSTRTLGTSVAPGSM